MTMMIPAASRILPLKRKRPLSDDDTDSLLVKDLRGQKEKEEIGAGR